MRSALERAAHEDVGETLRFPLSMADFREDQDHAGGLCHVLDVVLNLDVLKQAQAFRQGSSCADTLVLQATRVLPVPSPPRTLSWSGVCYTCQGESNCACMPVRRPCVTIFLCDKCRSIQSCAVCDSNSTRSSSKACGGYAWSTLYRGDV